ELAYWLRLSGEDVGVPDCAAEPWTLQLRGEARRAAAAWLAVECPYEAARALAGSDQEADLREALALFEQLGAAPQVGQVSRALRERGARGLQRGPRSSTRAHPAGLTVREAEVLQLLSQGLRNSDIAQR